MQNSEGGYERLNEMFAEQYRSADQRQRASVRRWQAKGRYYEQVQRAVQDGQDVSGEAFLVMSDLQRLAHPLPVDVLVWRGVRSARATFGAGIDELTGCGDQVVQRFMSMSVDEQVVRDEFIRPGADPAVLKVTARAGTAAVWLPPIGAPEMAYQGELLFRRGCMVRIVAVNTSDDVPIVEVEVSQL